jgi:acetate kinase
MTDDGAVLVVNTGSGSVKLDVLRAGVTVASEHLDQPPDSTEARSALSDFVEDAPELVGVGHRFVHGGPDLLGPHLVDADVRRRIGTVVPLAPLHLPPALAALDQCTRLLPDVPQVACFDTAFHAAMPEVSTTYAVPREWRERYGVRRYGFHGLSYAWALRRTAELLDFPAEELCVVIAHLGGGSSACAVEEGRSVSTSMGLTPLEGMVMVKRSGTVDPGMLLWLQTEHHLSAEEIAHALEHDSGLTALSGGLSGDTRVLVAAAEQGDRYAALAIDVYIHRAKQEIAAAAACLPRVDALVFTGEIGADQPEVRSEICAGLEVLGFSGRIDPEQDDDRILSRPGAARRVVLVHPREDRQIAEEVLDCLSA